MNFGLKVKHLISLLALSFLMACVPTAKQTKCSSGQAYDPNQRTCVPSLAGSTGNTIFINSKSPSNSYAMSITGAAVPHSITVTDIYNNGYQTRWFINFSNPPTTVSNQLVATGTNSFNFDPDMAPLLNAGAYTLEAIVYDASGLSVMDSESWSITVHPDDVPTIENIIPTSPSFTIANDILTYTFQASALNNDDAVGTYEWYLDGVSQGAGVAIPTGSGTTPVAINSLTINPTSLANGTHSVTLTFYDGTLNVYDSFTWGLLVTDPELPVVASYFPAAPDVLDAIDGVNQAANGYLKDNTPLVFTFTVDNYAKHPDGLEVVFNIDGGSVYSEAFVANTISVAAGLPAINLANSQIPETHILEIVLRTIGSNRIAAKYQWSLDVRPTNTSPMLTIDHATSTLTCNPVTPVSGTSSTDFEGKGCTVAQDASVNIVLEVEDEDYLNAFVQDYTHFGVTFTLDGDNLDGTASLSTSVCSSAPNGANTNAILTCALNMAAFNTLGPLDPGTYTLTAVAVDDGSPYTVTPANSNTVSWSINVTEINTAPVIQAQELALGSLPSLSNSYFELSNSGCASTGSYLNNTATIPAAQELGYVLIHTVIQDGERDDFKITIDFENANPALPANTYTNVVPTQTITRTNDTLNFIQTNCVQIPEWVRWAGVDGNVNIRISVTDIPSLMTTVPQSDLETLILYIQNNNPAPEFTVTTAESPLVGGSYDVMTGYPFTINPGSYQDTSTIDGNIITFQWQINYNAGGFVDIPDATNSVLTWTPSPDITNLDTAEIRLCLGDDGGNPADCTFPVATKTWSNLTLYTNINPAQTSDSDVAVWYDQTNSLLYQARLVGSSPTTIFVDQIDVTNNTILNTISFVDEVFAATNSDQTTDLSLIGKDGDSLYVSYKTVEGTGSTPQIRIRRIELDGYFYFNYGVSITGTVIGGTATLLDALDGPTQRVQFLGAPTAGQTIIINGVTATFGTDLCAPIATCSTAALAASALNTYVNAASGDPIIDEGLTSAYDGVITTTITKVVDWCDVSDKVSPTIGNLMFQGVNVAIPYTSVGDNQRVSIFSLGITGGPISCPLPTGGHTPVATGTFIQEIANDVDTTGNVYLALKNASGNVDVHKLDNSLALVAGAAGTQSNIFTLGSYNDIGNLSLSVSSASDPNVFVTALFDDGVTKDLGAAIFDANNYAQNSVISGFATTHDQVQDILNAKVIASESEDGAAQLAIVDDTYTTHMAKITMDDTVTYTGNLTFENRIYPPLSLDPGTTNSAIGISEVYFDEIFGDAGSVALENEKDIIFVIHHPADDAQTSLVNIEDGTTDTTSTGVTGSYPAFLPSN